MAFDPQLQRAVDAAADRFRDEMTRQTQAIAQELEVSARAERERAVAEARDAAFREADARMVARIAEVEIEARRLGREEGIKEGIRAGREEGRAQGKAAGQAEGREEGRQQGWAEGRAEGTIAGRAEGHEQGRAEGREQGRTEGLEQGRNEGLEQGRTEGLEQGRAEGREQGLTEGRELARTESRLEADRNIEAAVAEAVAAVRTDVQSMSLAYIDRWRDAVRTIGGARSLNAILDELVRAAEQEAAHAVLFLVENGRALTWKAGQVEADADVADLINEAARVGTIVSRSGRVAVPVIVGGQVVAALCAEGPQHDAIFELLAGFSARCLEAVTAFQAARVLRDVPEQGPGGDEPSVVTAVGDSMSEETVAARRYARLLVSEIKLYHEREVVAGRRDRDLATRLGGEIARARSLYEQRLPPGVQVDHFHEELVRTLADGDETLLTLKR